MEIVNKRQWKINKILYYLFKERFKKKINFDFPNNLNRWDLINQVINQKKFNSYLEIGCDDDYAFSQIKLKDKIGVDPSSGGNFRGTSDEFFQKNNRKFDCIFIDGLHEYDQVNKDIINSLENLNENGIILLHDCLPKSLNQQAVPRYQWVWNGDVWKCIVKFRCREDLDIVTCKIDHGISIIRKIKNKDKLNLIINDFKKLKFENFYYNHKEYMRIMEYNEVLEYIKS
ncbi:class I SAM-dependent methyltransferase [Candidatus Pelagibacter sp.]|uniref:class I SAM-dependent methyltransferase n=1 Tax=Candidatus Pelagibacter sp. TaxID=2024849 RepID=UPI003F84C68B